MSFFGSNDAPGITQYEMDRKNLHGKIRSVLPSGSSGNKKMVALDAAFNVAMDADTNTSSKQHVMQRDEFESIIDTLTKGGVLTSVESEKIREICEEYLSS